MSSSVKIIKILFQILVLTIVAYGLLCAVYSDVIIRNDNEFIDLSKLTLPDKPIEKNFSEIIGEKTAQDKQKTGTIDQEKKIYIFVLDTSSSTINKDIDRIPKKFDERIIDLDKTYNYQIDIKKDLDVLTLSKLRLYELFIDLYFKPEIYKNDEFSIWTLGDGGKRQYPEKEKKTGIEEKEVIEAVKKISELTIDNPDTSTDFNDLLDSILNSCETEFENNEFANDSPPDIVVTFVFDLLHDSDNKRLRNINENWKKLKRKVEDSGNSTIKVNLIILSDLDIEHRRSLYPLFNDGLEWRCLEKDYIGEDWKTDLLFPVTYANDNITFYYINPDHIADSSVILKFRDNKENKIRISLLGEDNAPVFPRMSIRCEVPGTGQNKKIFSGGSHFDAELKADQQIKLTYKNRVPPGFTSPFLKISDYNKRTSYLIPLYFAKKMPEKVANAFSFLQWLIKLLPLFIGIIAVFSVNELWKILLFSVPTLIYFLVIIL